MKKKLIFLFAVLTMFTSCSSDSDNVTDPEEPSKEESYKFTQKVDMVEFNIFDLPKFTLLNSEDGGLNMYLFRLSAVYDSITWSNSVQPGSFKIFTQKHANGYESQSMTTQWANAFYLPGDYETYLHGYKDGKIVYGDTLKIKVKNTKDFLMYNWSEVKEADDSSIGFVNVLNKDFELTATRVVEGEIPGVKIRVLPTLQDDNLFASLSDKLLYNYISTIYNEPIYGRDSEKLAEKYQELFLNKMLYVTPQCIWITPKSRIVLLHEDREGLKRTLIYAEPNR